jgi:hypothetical protein
MSLRSYSIAAVAVASALAAGCADGQIAIGSTTPSLTTAAVPERPDPVCAALAAQIDSLRKDAAAVKVEKASQSKTKVALTAAETAKVDQLNKANTEFQARCSTVKPGTVAAAPPAGAGGPAAQVASAPTPPKVPN